MSPGKDPSSLSGRTKKGMDLDISSAFKETDPARWVCCTGKDDRKEQRVRYRCKCLAHFPSSEFQYLVF